MRDYKLLGSADLQTITDPNAKLALAQRIGKTTLWQHFSLAMSKIHRESENNTDIDTAIAEWYHGQQLGDYTQQPGYNRIAPLVDALRQQNPQIDHRLISTEALLRLFTWVRENEVSIPDAGTSVFPDLMDDLLSLTMLFNDEVNANEQIANTSAEAPNDTLKPYRKLLAGSFPCDDLEKANVADLAFSQFAKSIKVLDFMENTPKYQVLHRKLLADFGCTTNVELVQAIGGIIINAIRIKKGYTTITIEQNADFEANVALFEKLTIQTITGPNPYGDDFRGLRGTPIYKIAEGEYRSISDPFLVNVMYSGLMFYCSRLCRADPTLLNGNRDFPPQIRMDFSEKVLVADMCASLFDKAGDIRQDGGQLDAIFEHDGQAAPDYYTARGNGVFLFESKEVLMSGENKLSYDFTIIDGQLKRDGHIEKGTKQLAKNTLRVLQNRLPLPAGMNPYTVDVYPVLIVHSPLYSSQGMNFWANRWFDDRMQLIRDVPANAGIDISRVKPLTIIEIDTLLLYEERFKSANFDLREEINRYHAQVAMRAVPAAPSRAVKHATEQISFAEYIRIRAAELGIMPDMEKLLRHLRNFGIN
ncbi:hypothetical protein [Chitinophaga tropicalis]|uniref:Uncharacterized protein n=1 Tax=Chitinophaga tropicalis TaxID=2683588 RepID=A0A7K1U6T2_9BACT|nr:hypothetical protein [Chitinophaga tropicalis]MVT10050.1 hypothetical protein [Chitinophaga tropicalis]